MRPDRVCPGVRRAGQTELDPPPGGARSPRGGTHREDSFPKTCARPQPSPSRPWPPGLPGDPRGTPRDSERPPEDESRDGGTVASRELWAGQAGLRLHSLTWVGRRPPSHLASPRGGGSVHLQGRKGERWWACSTTLRAWPEQAPTGRRLRAELAAVTPGPGLAALTPPGGPSRARAR